MNFISPFLAGIFFASMVWSVVLRHYEPAILLSIATLACVFLCVCDWKIKQLEKLRDESNHANH